MKLGSAVELSDSVESDRLYLQESSWLGRDPVPDPEATGLLELVGLADPGGDGAKIGLGGSEIG
jgi:hypothetical protein